MLRMAATTSAGPGPTKGLSEISTITTEPSRRLATNSMPVPMGRERGWCA